MGAINPTEDVLWRNKVCGPSAGRRGVEGEGGLAGVLTQEGAPGRQAGI